MIVDSSESEREHVNGRVHNCLVQLRCNLDLILRKDLIETGWATKVKSANKKNYSFQELPHNYMHAEYKNWQLRQFNGLILARVNKEASGRLLLTQWQQINKKPLDHIGLNFGFYYRGFTTEHSPERRHR